MASSDVEIANLALSHLAISTEIATLTEKSKEAQACNRFYAQARDEVLRDFPWPFAGTIALLALVTDFSGVTNPAPEWRYAYRYPADCLRARRILSGFRNDTRQTRVPYRIFQDASGGLLYTDRPTAQLEYTVRVTTVARFQPDFVEALAYRLAAHIAPRVTSVNVQQLQDRALQLYQQQLAIARANALNEEQSEEDPDAELIRSRS